jgi:hypothetical protein
LFDRNPRINQPACLPERYAGESGESAEAVLYVRSGSMNNQYHIDCHAKKNSLSRNTACKDSLAAISQ